MQTTPQLVSQSLDNQEPSSEEKPQTTYTSQSVAQRPIWEVIAELGEQIPEEEWAQVPTNASINYKHYLYGAPKKNG